ncbi:MAG TPA: hypothetical protein VF487_10310 [Chitinophagaceae bacterium]
MKSVFRSWPIKHLMILLFSFPIALMACSQDKKPAKGKIESTGKVNMKELEEKEKKTMTDTLKKKKFETGPEQNTQSKSLPVPKDAKVKKTEITPGQMKKDSAHQKSNKRDSAGSKDQ